MKRRSLGRLAALLWLPAASPSLAAQDDQQQAELPERASTLVVYGNDPCPQTSEEEIVVCARRPEDERYRIPKALREDEEKRGEVAWATRAEALEEASRPARPGSCSVVGTYGQSGCFAESVRQWLADRAARKSSNVP